jgi:hypothetical protein
MSRMVRRDGWSRAPISLTLSERSGARLPHCGSETQKARLVRAKPARTTPTRNGSDGTRTRDLRRDRPAL